MSWAHVQALFAALPPVLRHGALLAVYGPFNYGGRYTSDSNAQFDAWLKARDPRSGIRDSEAVQALAADHGFTRLGMWRCRPTTACCCGGWGEPSVVPAAGRQPIAPG
jgi:hypothetical protein